MNDRSHLTGLDFKCKTNACHFISSNDFIVEILCKYFAFCTILYVLNGLWVILKLSWIAVGICLIVFLSFFCELCATDLPVRRNSTVHIPNITLMWMKNHFSCVSLLHFQTTIDHLCLSKCWYANNVCWCRLNENKEKYRAGIPIHIKSKWTVSLVSSFDLQSQKRF